MEKLPVFGSTVELDGKVRTVNGTLQLRPNGAPRRMSKAYRTTDPAAVVLKLTEADFTVSEARTLHGSSSGIGGSMKRSAWRVGLEVLFPKKFGHPDDYRARARILLAHTGRDSLLMGLGALRSQCANQFTGSEIRIRHTDPEIDWFNADPAAVLMGLREHCHATVNKIENLRGRPFAPLLLECMESFPRIARTVREELPHYREGGERFAAEPSAWCLAQSLTGSRQPRALKAAYLLCNAAGDLADPNNPTLVPYFKLFSKN
jgi:hypothetical protein